MRLVDGPHLEPHRTPLGLLSPKGYVDFEADVIFGGRLYLSETEAGEAARLFGYASPDEASDLQERAESAESRIAELETDLAELLPIRDFVARYGDRQDDEPVRGRAA